MLILILPLFIKGRMKVIKQYKTGFLFVLGELLDLPLKLITGSSHGILIILSVTISYYQSEMLAPYCSYAQGMIFTIELLGTLGAMMFIESIHYVRDEKSDGGTKITFREGSVVAFAFIIMCSAYLWTYTTAKDGFHSYTDKIVIPQDRELSTIIRDVDAEGVERVRYELTDKGELYQYEARRNFKSFIFIIFLAILTDLLSASFSLRDGMQNLINKLRAKTDREAVKDWAGGGSGTDDGDDPDGDTGGWGDDDDDLGVGG